MAQIVENKDSSLNVLVHPMVIFNISDHFMRTKASGSDPAPRVLGCIAGTLAGRNVEIHTTFETTFSVSGDQAIIDVGYLKNRLSQFRQVYPTLDVLGWYTNGTAISVADLKTHKQILEFNESPLILLLDTNVAGQKELPVRIFEVDHENLVNIPYKIEASPAEGIAVNHISKHTSSGEDAAARLQVHLSGLHSSVKMLGGRVRVLINYLASLTKGEFKPTPAVLRQISALCHRMPTLDTSSFQKDHLSEYNDAVLVAYLASLTRSTQTLNDVVDRFNYGFERHSRRRGFF